MLGDNGKHDDQVDSTAQFLDWFKKPFPGQNVFELYRREAEKGKPPNQSMSASRRHRGSARSIPSPAGTSRSARTASSRCLTEQGAGRWYGRSGFEPGDPVMVIAAVS